MKRPRMSFRLRPEREEDPKPACSERDGAEPVGQLHDLSEIDQHIVGCIRLWMDGPDYHRTMAGHLGVIYGGPAARRLTQAFEAFMSAIAVSISEQICRHGPSCPCLGRDEALLLAIVRHAGVGDTFSASVHASTIVGQHRLIAVIEAAGALAFEMTSVCAGTDVPARMPQPTHTTSALH